MTTLLNDRDALLQNATMRGVTTAGSKVLLTSNSSSFFVQADGTHAPDVIEIDATLLLLDGPVTFVGQNCTLSNVTALSCQVAYSTVVGTSAIVTATAANGGSPESQSIVLGVLRNGTNGTGTNGARGAGHYYVTGSAWSDATASAACPGGPEANDVVTIWSSGYAMEKVYTPGATPSPWVTQGAVYNGSLIVTKSVTAAALSVNQLDAVTGIIGTLQTAASGGRTQIKDNLITVFDTSSAPRVKIGNTSLSPT